MDPLYSLEAFGHAAKTRYRWLTAKAIENHLDGADEEAWPVGALAGKLPPIEIADLEAARREALLGKRTDRIPVFPAIAESYDDRRLKDDPPERSSSASGGRSLPAGIVLGVAIEVKSTISPTLTFSLFSPTLDCMAQLMQVRQAARALGVHENTVRRWEERGLLRAVRLPSGVRRFRAEDVEAMRAQMFSGFAPLREDDDVVPVARARSID